MVATAKRLYLDVSTDGMKMQARRTDETYRWLLVAAVATAAVFVCAVIAIVASFYFSGSSNEVATSGTASTTTTPGSTETLLPSGVENSEQQTGQGPAPQISTTQDTALEDDGLSADEKSPAPADDAISGTALTGIQRARDDETNSPNADGTSQSSTTALAGTTDKSGGDDANDQSSPGMQQAASDTNSTSEPADNSESGQAQQQAADRALPSGPVKYVATNGNDGGPGTEESPWRSVAFAVSQAQPGDTILVRAGRYEEYLDEHAGIRITTSGTPNNVITLSNYPGERPVLTTSARNLIQFYGPSYWTVQGFNLTGQNRGSTPHFGSGFGIGNKSHSITVRDNYVHGFPGGGIETYNVDRLTIEGNRVWGNSFYAPNQTSGISIYQAVDLSGRRHSTGFNNVIQNNVVFNNENRVVGPAGVVTDGNCIIIDDNRNTQNSSTNGRYGGTTLIRNNVCVNNGGRGIQIYLSDNVTAVNNTLLWNARHPAIDQGELSAIESSNIVFRNNAVQSRPGLDPIKLWQSSNVTFDHNMYAETKPSSLPNNDRFIDSLDLRSATRNPSTSNYGPNASSPLKGAGSANGAPSFDAVGARRGRPPSVGALE